MKVGIAIMVKNPSDFDIWLKYHITYLRFNRIYIRVEDTPGLQLILNKYKNKINYVLIDTKEELKKLKKENLLKNMYFSAMIRQKKYISSTISLARKDEIEYLLHIDDDELLFISDEFKNVNDLFRFLKKKNPNASEFHFSNIEAVFKKNKKSCFDTDKFIECKKSRSKDEPGCKAYINGKSAGNISDEELKYYGPHKLKGTGDRVNVKKDIAKILHFESCSYDRWYKKFSNMNNMDKEKFNKIPFKFYKDSIEKISKCEKDCKKDMYKFWEKIKVDPYYNKDISKYLIKITNEKINY